MKNAGTVLAVVLIVVLVVLLLGGAGMMGFGGFGMMGGYGGYGGMMGGYSGGGMMGGYGFNPFGAILSFVFWTLIIGGVVLLVVWIARNANISTIAQRSSLSTGVGELPLDILKSRYARGEVTKEQFDEMKKVLEA